MTKVSDCTRLTSLNNETYLARPNRIDLNSNELHYIRLCLV